MLELPLLLRFTGVLDLDLDLLLLLSRWFPPLDLRRSTLPRFPWEFRSCDPRLPLEVDNDDDDADAAAVEAEDGRFILDNGRRSKNGRTITIDEVRVVVAAKVPVRHAEYR